MFRYRDFIAIRASIPDRKHSPRQFHFFATHARCRQFHCFVNLDVAGTAAKISRQRFLDLLRVGFGFFFNSSSATSRNPGEQ